MVPTSYLICLFRNVATEVECIRIELVNYYHGRRLIWLTELLPPPLLDDGLKVRQIRGIDFKPPLLDLILIES